MEITKLIQSLKERKIALIGVSKYVDEKAILRLFELGVHSFGENKIQDLRHKQNLLQDRMINWHFIGNLQSNKINQMIEARPILWQSCVGLEQALKVNKRLEYKLDALLEVNFANEDSKMGCLPELAFDEYIKIKNQCKNINLRGIMSIGALDPSKLEASFKQCFKLYQSLQEYGANICSMGMSGDYEKAIDCGSNMVRLGSILFK